MKPPLDTDLHVPVVFAREAAAARLLELLPPDLVDAVWDEIIGPLYDSRQMSMGWTRGSCRRCSTPHPESQRLNPNRPWPGHRTTCPKYVGPLEHRIVNGHQVLMGWRVECACGQGWLEYDDDGNKQQCPDLALDWRGPRPEETPA